MLQIDNHSPVVGEHNEDYRLRCTRPFPSILRLAGSSHAKKWTFETITSIQMSCIRRLEYQTRHHCTRTICRPLHRFHYQIEICARYMIYRFFFYPSWSL